MGTAVTGGGGYHRSAPRDPLSGTPLTGSGTPLTVSRPRTAAERIRPRYILGVEALVRTTAEPGQLLGMLPEHLRICSLCREVKSVAEISALLRMPLGITRLLVADVAEEGLVAIHQSDGPPEAPLIERVLMGLRGL
ncbi:DUF742 domain-containing protein [Streptomyces sp. NPDC088387]|uniref:DUF742 domain-containing protein n=1 Tax=Streptomyces sp. NPDC088387 TaxID=3365859 RepID=UPI0037F18DF6